MPQNLKGPPESIRGWEGTPPPCVHPCQGYRCKVGIAIVTIYYCAFVDCTGLCLFYLVCYYLKEVEVKGNIKPETDVNKYTVYRVEEKMY